MKKIELPLQKLIYERKRKEDELYFKRVILCDKDTDILFNNNYPTMVRLPCADSYIAVVRNNKVEKTFTSKRDNDGVFASFFCKLDEGQYELMFFKGFPNETIDYKTIYIKKPYQTFVADIYNCGTTFSKEFTYNEVLQSEMGITSYHNFTKDTYTKFNISAGEPIHMKMTAINKNNVEYENIIKFYIRECNTTDKDFTDYKCLSKIKNSITEKSKFDGYNGGYIHYTNGCEITQISQDKVVTIGNKVFYQNNYKHNYNYQEFSFSKVHPDTIIIVSIWPVSNSNLLFNIRLKFDN